MVYDELNGAGYAPSVRPRVYNQSATAVSVKVRVTDDKTYTINVGRKGKISGFLCTVNLITAVASDGCYIYLKRNGNLLSSLYLFGPTLAGATTGVVFAETLGFLSGAEVDAADIFTLQLQKDQADAADYVFDVAMTLVVQED